MYNWYDGWRWRILITSLTLVFIVMVLSAAQFVWLVIATHGHAPIWSSVIVLAAMLLSSLGLLVAVLGRSSVRRDIARVRYARDRSLREWYARQERGEEREG